MTVPVQYLEAARLEELAQELRRDGYHVTPHEQVGNVIFDLVATKGDRTIAIQVKARSQLRQSAKDIQELREEAGRQGFAEFRLVVVNPPREKSIEIEGLEDSLLSYIVHRMGALPELDQLSSRSQPQGISELEIDSLDINVSDIRVAGTGILEVLLEYGGGELRDGIDWTTSFPFDFVAVLDHNLEVAEVLELQVDTSSFYE